MYGNRTKSSGRKTLRKTFHPLADVATASQPATDGRGCATAPSRPPKEEQHRISPTKANASGVPDSIPRELPNERQKNPLPESLRKQEVEKAGASLPEKAGYKQTEQAHCTPRPQTISGAAPTLLPSCGQKQAPYNWSHHWREPDPDPD